MNCVNGIGTFSHDPVLQTSKNGTEYVRFQIVLPSGNHKKSDGSLLNCIAFGKRAKLICRDFKKKDRIGIEASIETEMYEGNLITSYSIDNFTYIERLSKSENQSHDQKEVIHDRDEEEEIDEEELRELRVKWESLKGNES